MNIIVPASPKRAAKASQGPGLLPAGKAHQQFSAYAQCILFNSLWIYSMAISVNINGKDTAVNADASTPILWALRDTLGMTGTKFGCGIAMCGACTVHLNGSAIRSCVTPLSAAVGQKITTIEALASDRTGKAVQDAWVKHDVAQCGYCQSGQVMSATALLKTNTKPTDADIDAAMAGNICRCGTYVRIRAAIKDAAVALA
jgi:isoquinoline 1-oxidoreductase subunit alpha